MKDIFRKAVLSLLGVVARRRLKKLSPMIIGISGSVGKTSTKEAIAHILGKNFTVLKSSSSYNTDFGIYLTILEEKSGLGSAKSWLKVLFRAFKKTFLNVKPVDFLILEMGTDQPGDMKVLLDIVVPDIAVMTRISENHLSEGQFPSLEAMFEEDVILQRAVSHKKDNFILMNADDPYQQQFIKKYKNPAELGLYSVSHQVGEEDAIESSIQGLSFTCDINGEKIMFSCPILGTWHVEVLLPAIMLAYRLGMTTDKIQKALLDYRLPAGRMNLIPGKGATTIIDSSYNASPLAVEKALGLLGNMTSGRRVFVFGNMNELGDQSNKLHAQIGKFIPENVDMLITVGPGPQIAAKEAIKQGFPEDQFFAFDDALQAASFYAKQREQGDIILVKGSQNKVRLERFIKAIMKNPADASALLVRQSEEWNMKQ
ncbi:MAG: Mur ligase family protein [Candidatus Gracilibacteria bacterium]